jgi:alkanesulfonate monooxygenase SsuD/methylene tetrahydromethanopterin reductase-like flavin-dependent oxidoreductase (luciferase family)
MTKLGVFVVPDATDPEKTIGQIVAADRAGLELVGVQDHPYQRRFFDTWTLLSYVAARTERITLLPDVINLPLRQPAVLAKAAASLDVLSGGRVELGLGAGAFWEGVEAMGGPRRTPGESVQALEEAMRIMRAFLDMEPSVRLEGEHYRAGGARPGPPPAHRIGLWVGAYRPRMLRLTGRLGDGWLPSVGGSYLSEEEVPERQRAIDEAARRAGRDPAAIVRAANVGLGDKSGWLDAERIAEFAGGLRFDAVLLSPPDDDPLAFIGALGETAAALRGQP